MVNDNKKAQLSIGSEYDVYKNMIKLRGGYNTVQEVPSFGVGLKYAQINLDYNYSINSGPGNVSKFGFILEF